MTELSHKILAEHQIRKTFQQKTAFIQLLKQHFPELSVQESSFLKCRNLIIGDVESADVILSAHYDTCANLPFPNFIAPKNPVLSVLYCLLPYFAIIFPVNLLLNLYTNRAILHWIISIILSFVIGFLIIAGPANKCNTNDNTSGVIVLCELLNILSKLTKQKVAFVFFDLEELRLVGSRLFLKKYKDQLDDKLLINFDSVSDGSHLMICANKSARENYSKKLKTAFLPTEELSILFTSAEKTIFPSDQKGFPCSVVIATLKHKWYLGYYLDRIHTKKDTVFISENIRHICNCILCFLRQR